MKNFGKLNGLTLLLSGVVSMLQIPMVAGVLHFFDGDFTIPNIILTVLTVPLYVIPYYLYKEKV